jgi:hypothetical protein
VWKHNQANIQDAEAEDRTNGEDQRSKSMTHTKRLLRSFLGTKHESKPAFNLVNITAFHIAKTAHCQGNDTASKGQWCKQSPKC